MSENIYPLSELCSGDEGEVVSFAQSGSYYRQKLISLGLMPGVTFKILRVAPLGCPMEVLVRGCALSLRKQEIDILKVEKLLKR